MALIRIEVFSFSKMAAISFETNNLNSCLKDAQRTVMELSLANCKLKEDCELHKSLVLELRVVVRELSRFWLDHSTNTLTNLSEVQRRQK